ncbi:sulfatase-like hydrolase/transferase [Halorubellus sp. JP-L1]|uniref:sulfatase-like hydrolase/transferase n=1 Tax=Halorubellus sp. JP-L1 TaxID=2715753 RepID=UPI001408049E|nr:sulfatase-like hydrolase/transferase [Halorubellus sp. JP-L1]NHN43620.1 sulfatase-like hydrolase/transferase [Halorubellus sp. JP-L1]
MDRTDTGRNVLFVVLDTVRKDHLSVYDYDRPTTPALEEFANEAAVYEQAVSPAPWTLPVHASMFTGLYPSEHGASQENPYLEDATTLAESLSETHRSACYSSNAWITPYTHLTDGFDDQDNFFEVMPGDFLSGPLAKVWKTMNDNDHLRAVADWLVSVGNMVHEYTASGEGADSKTPEVIDKSKQFIAAAERDGENWFQFVNLMDAHLPYHPPQEYADEFAPGVDSTAVCQNSKEYNSGARDIDADEFDDLQGLYDAEIRHMDAQLDRLFSWMREEGVWEDTMVVVCADHGELFGEHDLYGHEFCIYDPLVNVPCMVKHPDVDAERHDEQFEMLDLYHTVLDHAGGDAPGSLTADATAVDFDPARSLLRDEHRAFDDPAFDGSERDRGEYAFVEYYRPVVELKQLEQKASAAGIALEEDSRFYSRMRASRRTDAKYVRNERIDDEFYRLDDDPGETRDLAGGARGEATAEDEAAMDAVEAALAAFEDRRGGEWKVVEDDDVLADMDEDAKDRLQDLGYLE